METETEIYFYDADERWSYFDKEEIGEAFVFIDTVGSELDCSNN